MRIARISRKKTGARIEELMREHHFDPTDIQEELDLCTASTVYRWMRGESLPGTERLYQLSQLFGVDIGDILALEEPVVLHAWKKEASRGQNAGQISQP